MGSMIHLAVGRLEIDWGKNSGFNDHSPLYQPTDLKRVPYYYTGEIDLFDEENPYKEVDGFNPIVHYKEGLSKPLGQVIERIDLLGYTMPYARMEFAYLSQLNSFDKGKFSFDQLAEALASVDVNTISTDYGEGEDFGKFFSRYIFDRLDLQRIVKDPNYVRYHAGQGMENLSTYTILRLLAENPSARGLPVNWQFADIIDGGWGRRENFIKPLDPEDRFLIVTEGRSDATIIKHALSLLKPHIADFFDFVDMNEGYPFSGTGNLYNFTKGLVSIAVQNNVIILYDNDAEGVFSFNRTHRLNLLKNMRVIRLPDRTEFKSIKTIGPSGNDRADINGRAAAIECYLDLGENPVIRWTGYNKEIDAYHGEIEGKAGYMRRFLELKEAADGYDFTKIEAVLSVIIQTCVAMREAERLAGLEEELPEDVADAGWDDQTDT